MDDAQNEPFWTWADLLLFLGLGIPAFVIAFAVVRLAMTPFTANKALLLMIPQFAALAAMLLPVALGFRWKYDQPFWRAIRMGIQSRAVLTSIGAGFLLAVSVLLMAVALRTPDFHTPMQELMNDPGSAAWVAVFAVSIGPAFEEVFFRGLLQPLTVRSAGIFGGIAIVAVLFALLHGPQYAWSWRHVLLISLAGCGFGWWRLRTQSTGASVLMHAGYNSVLVIGYFLGRTAL